MRTYLARELYAYSPHYRRSFDDAGIKPRTLRHLSDVVRMGMTTWKEVAADPASFVLRPDESSIARYGDRRLVAAVTSAKLRGRAKHINRNVIDPAFKPVHWHLVDGVPVGSSADDLDRLGEAGARTLSLAEIGEDDVLVTLLPSGPGIGFSQLAGGARAAGISALHLGLGADADVVRSAAPAALAGEAKELARMLRLLGGGAAGVRGGRRPSPARLDTLRTLIVAGEPLDAPARRRLRGLGRRAGARDLEIVSCWAPRGVRAMWAQCRGGDAFHTYPDLECLELIGSFLDMAEVEGTGELLWSSLAWHGTAFFRLRTNTKVTLRDETCPNCGRVGPRLLLGGATETSLRRRGPKQVGLGKGRPKQGVRKKDSTPKATARPVKASKTAKPTRTRRAPAKITRATRAPVRLGSAAPRR